MAHVRAPGSRYLRHSAMTWRDDYQATRTLPDGRTIGIVQMVATFALFVGLDDGGYRGRYCYEFQIDVWEAFDLWDGHGDPPGPWIKYKGRPSERLGPGAAF